MKLIKDEELKKLNIFEKMLLIQTELQTVAKNLNVGSGFNSYKAVSERDVIDAVKPLEASYHIYSYPKEREIVESDFIEKYNSKGEVIKSFWLRVKVTFEFINVDNPTEKLEIVSYGDGIDTGDKATGKAMTYADKYALMKAYKISTGDDPDKDASEKYNSKGSFESNVLELNELEKELKKYEFDRHDEAVIDYVKSKAKIEYGTLDPAIIAQDNKATKAVVKVYKQLLKVKQEKDMPKINEDTQTY